MKPCAAKKQVEKIRYHSKYHTLDFYDVCAINSGETKTETKTR